MGLIIHALTDLIVMSLRGANSLFYFFGVRPVWISSLHVIVITYQDECNIQNYVTLLYLKCSIVLRVRIKDDDDDDDDLHPQFSLLFSIVYVHGTRKYVI